MNFGFCNIAKLFLYLFALVLLVDGKEDPGVIRGKLTALISQGDFGNMMTYLEQVERDYGTLNIDEEAPSLFSYKGIALHNAHRGKEAMEAFRIATTLTTKDSRAWINLGEQSSQLFFLNEAVDAYREAYKMGDGAVLPRLLHVQAWAGVWEGFEELAVEIEYLAKECVANVSACKIDSTTAFEYTDIPGWISKQMHQNAPNAKASHHMMRESDIAPLWPTKPHKSNVLQANAELTVGASGSSLMAPSGTGVKTRRLKVGFVSSDFGVHPVSSLIRGVVQRIDKKKIELFAFALQVDRSWWGLNISGEVEHFYSLHELVNTQDAATFIAKCGVEILIDLNGHTLHSGLPMMSHRPSPIQMSFLGLPTTTGADSFIDYYIGDYVALPPEHADHFSERLIMLNPCYIANDYAQMRGDVLALKENRFPKESLQAKPSLSKAGIVLGTLSNFMKMDPFMFQVWMNIMRGFPTAHLVMMSYAGSGVSSLHAMNNTKGFGIKQERLGIAPQSPWNEHLQKKTAFDMLLDTSSKNGHTTGLDGLWSGVPTISIGGGASMTARAGESIAAAMETDYMMTYSLKEYEDLAYSLLKDKQRNLKVVRHHIEEKRSTSALFNNKQWTASFEHSLQATWEAVHVAKDEMEDSEWLNGLNLPGLDNAAISTNVKKTPRYVKQRKLTKYNIVSHTEKPPTQLLHTHQVDDNGNDCSLEYYFEEVERLKGGSQPSIKPKTRHQPPVKSDRKETAQPSVGTTEAVATSKHDSIKHEGAVAPDIDLTVEPIPHEVMTSENIFLNIGGVMRSPGWFNVNAQRQNYMFPSDQIDIIRPMDNLHGIRDQSVSAVYSSHTLEHATFGDRGVQNTLLEWHRVLKNGGILMVAVPDMHTLARMYLDTTLSFDNHVMVTRMMFGGQTDAHDYHYIGFDEMVLASLLQEAGFCAIERVGNFNLFAACVMSFYLRSPNIDMTVYLAASALNAWITGSAVFAGAVDCRAFLQLAKGEKEDDPNDTMIASHLTVWLPNVKMYMIPLCSLGLLLNIIAFNFSKNNTWLLCAACYLGSELITYSMVKKIEELRQSISTAGNNELAERLSTLSQQHGFRILLSLVALIASNIALSAMMKPK